MAQSSPRPNTPPTSTPHPKRPSYRKKLLDSPRPHPLVYQTNARRTEHRRPFSQSAPPKDRPGKPAPARIAEILAVVSILATYGRHLAETLEQRAVARGFATIARFFGTAAFDTILAHIQRGLMRAVALERVLLRRAARGRDLRILAPRAPSGRKPPANDHQIPRKPRHQRRQQH